jgi:hypothetical protein
MSTASVRMSAITVGAVPRIDLLPPEVHARQKLRAARRGMALIVLLVVVLTGAGVGYATLQATASQAALASEQARTNDLLQQQLEFVEVTSLDQQLAALTEAIQVGASTEILWREYMQTVVATLPAGASIAVQSVQTSSPITTVQQPSVPLQQARVATIVLSVASPDLPTVSQWIAQLSSLEGFADATLSTIEPTEGGGVLASVMIGVTAEAFANRFVEFEETSK